MWVSLHVCTQSARALCDTRDVLYIWVPHFLHWFFCHFLHTSDSDMIWYLPCLFGHVLYLDAPISIFVCCSFVCATVSTLPPLSLASLPHLFLPLPPLPHLIRPIPPPEQGVSVQLPPSCSCSYSTTSHLAHPICSFFHCKKAPPHFRHEHVRWQWVLHHDIVEQRISVGCVCCGAPCRFNVRIRLLWRWRGLTAEGFDELAGACESACRLESNVVERAL